MTYPLFVQNAALQAVASTNLQISGPYQIQNPRGSHGKVSETVRKTLEILRSPSSMATNGKVVATACKDVEKLQKYVCNRQMDSGEFLNDLIEVLAEDTNTSYNDPKVILPAYDDTKHDEYLTKVLKSSGVTSTIATRTQSCIQTMQQCGACSYESINFSMVYPLNLALVSPEREQELIEELAKLARKWLIANYSNHLQMDYFTYMLNGKYYSKYTCDQSSILMPWQHKNKDVFNIDMHYLQFQAQSEQDFNGYIQTWKQAQEPTQSATSHGLYCSRVCLYFLRHKK